MDKKNNESLDTLGERLRGLRDERELTLDMVVWDLGRTYNVEIQKGTLSKWENGVNLPSLYYAAFLCKYYGVSLDYLIGNTDTRTPVDLLVMKPKQGGKNADG